MVGVDDNAATREVAIDKKLVVVYVARAFQLAKWF
jgi:hypothetical protein